MAIEIRNKLNKLLQSKNNGGLYFSEWLKRQGYSDQLLRQYRTSRWFSSLANGVMYRTGDTLSAYAAIACLNEQMGRRYRIAAHSALELAGFNHYVPMGKPVLMVAHHDAHVPKWISSNLFDTTIQPFSTDTFGIQQEETMTIEGRNLLVSSPEQAFLECLLLAPKQYDYTDLYYIMEQLTTLRPDVLQSLLEHTKSQKVKRMFLYMASKAQHYWYGMLETSRIDLGTSKLQLVKGGAYVQKYRITIPKELKGYE